MQVKDLIDVNIEDLVPEASTVKLSGLELHVRKATLRDEIKFKELYGPRLETLQTAMLNTNMEIILGAFWLLLSEKSRDKLRSVQIEDESGEILDKRTLDSEHEILTYLSAGSMEKSLIIHSITKSFCGEKVLESEIKDEELKKKIIKKLKYKKTK